MKPLLHPQTEAGLDSMSANPTNAYIFHGSPSVGKFTAALWLGAKLNCQNGTTDDCATCRAIFNHNYPDVITIEPEDKSVGIGQIQQLQQSLQLAAYTPAGHRLVIIDQAETMTTEAQNCLLKTLEEPAAGTTIILVASDLSHLTPTIRSRSQQLYFNPVTDQQITEWLVRQHVQPSKVAGELAILAEGLPGLAARLASDATYQQQYTESHDLAQQLVNAGRFERLVAASKLATDSALVDNFITALVRVARKAIRSDQGLQRQRATNWLSAVERFSDYRASNVNLRAAIEGLMLEL